MSTWMTNLKPQELVIVGSPAVSGMESRASWVDTSECGDDHTSGSCKEMTLLQIAANVSQKPDWLWILGDDNYVIPTLAELAVQKYDPNKPVILGTQGCAVQGTECRGSCGGAGELISRGALEQMFEKGNVQFATEYKSLIQTCRYFGDMTTSTVATHHGVTFQSIKGVYGWAESTERISAILKGDSLPLLFHYVSPSQMYAVHTLVNQMDLTSYSMPAFAKINNAWKYEYDAKVAKYIKDANSQFYSKSYDEDEAEVPFF